MKAKLRSSAQLRDILERTRSGKAGFSLIEVVASIFILAIVAWHWAAVS